MSELYVLQKMKIVPRIGVDQVRFGMVTGEVVTILGDPDKDFVCDDGERRFRYNSLGLILTFESVNENRLGWIIVANPSSILYGKKVIGESFLEVESSIDSHIQETKSLEDYELWSSTTWGDTWLEVQETAGWVTEVHLGVPFGVDDCPVWPED